MADAEPWLDFSSITSQVLPASPAFLLDLAQRRFRGVDEEPRRTILMQQAERLIEQGDFAESERAALRGRMLAIGGNVTRAIREYFVAVQQPAFAWNRRIRNSGAFTNGSWRKSASNPVISRKENSNLHLLCVTQRPLRLK